MSSAMLRRNIMRIHGHIIALSRVSSNPTRWISSIEREDQFHKKFESADSPGFFFARNFSSIGERRNVQDEDPLEEGFSDLDSSPTSEKATGIDQESESEQESDETEDEEALGLNENPKWTSPSPLFKVIVDASSMKFNSALDEWIAGNSIGRSEIYAAILGLRRRRLFGKALLFFEWLELKKKLSFVERDYASRLDLTSKVHGLIRAEKYLEKIPKSMRGELVYRTLLANCVAASRVEKAEEVFNKMRELEFPLTSFVCNQLLVLYKRLDRKKMADVLLIMEKEGIKPTLFTYRVLIDAKGRARDISGMEKVMENMKRDGLEPSSPMKALIAQHYISLGFKDKAEELLKDMEGDDARDRKSLILLYASLGKEAEVERIWKACEENPRMDQCLAAIEAYGKLGRVDAAEEVFERMHKQFKKLSIKYYNSLLRVYGHHQMLEKGKELVKRMADDGCPVGPLTWDALIGLYVRAGEVEKADELLHKAGGQGKERALHSSFMAVMEKYAERGDVHNTEKLFYRMRQSGYVSRLTHFRVLFKAYVNGEMMAYGFRERMKADNVFPSKSFSAEIAAADAFRKTQVSALLD